MHPVAAQFQVPLKQIFEDVSAEISNVRPAINGRPTRVHSDRMRGRIAWLEFLNFARVGIKESQRHAVNLAAAWRSRRAGYGIKEVPGFSQRLNDSGLSRARWSGNDKENSVPAESVTQDFELARGSSPVRPCSR